MKICKFCKHRIISSALGKKACSVFGKTFEEIFEYTTLDIGRFGCIFYTNVSKHEGIDHELRVIPKIAELKEMLTDIIKSWESLAGNKNYRPKEIENWLINQMKPTIDNARTLLSNFTA